ncbi:endonuclease/exonuclease/phosphatase family protein [Curtobacterium sp. 22159]|uniref:endonuclease/exonuclease/phosphatase family protein n=1 Tax=Curtobacterium sp. 22159 TaxID=3453882 RepID=UPI003F86A15F
MSRPVLVPAVTAAAVLLLGGGYVFAPWLGLGRAPVLAAVLPARAVVTIGLLGTAVLLLVVAAIRRRLRPAISVAAVVLLLLAGASGGIISVRGLRNDPPVVVPGDLRVFEWNTNGGLVGPRTIARAAVSARADVVVLPDAGDASRAAAVDRALRTDERPMRLFRGGTDAQTAVLVRVDLATRYTARSGIDPVRSIVLTAPGSPTIVALHAPQPLLRGLAGWSADLRWVRDVCSPRSDVIVSGDFNASVDAFAGAGLGACSDAASIVHGAGVGTWPTSVPTSLGMPLDHTLVEASAGLVRSWTVITAEDGSGARHRPTLTVVEPDARASA